MLKSSFFNLKVKLKSTKGKLEFAKESMMKQSHKKDGGGEK
jgi:hypothetical protein